MKLTRAQKVEKSKTLSERVKTAQHLFFTEYQGLRFQDLQALRDRLRGVRCRYAVMKNSLVRHALGTAGIEGGQAGILKGPVGMAVVEGDDPIVAAKTLAAFGKEFPKLKIKAGFVDRQWISQEDCKTLSSLGSKGEVIAGLAGALYGVGSQLASVLQAPFQDLALLLKAVEEKQEKATT